MDFEINLPNLKLTDEDLIEDLRRVSALVQSDSLKRADYEKHGRYAYTSFRNHFGSWKKALESAGLTRSRNWGTTPEEFFQNLKNVWIRLGRQPKYSEMIEPVSEYSGSAYAYTFGSWTKTLIAFEKYLAEDSEPDSLEILSTVEVIPLSDGHKTKRQPSLRLRFKVMKKDNFCCVACGQSPAKDPRIELHIDHIRPWSKGGETVIENLQTLCKQCNLGKGNVE